MKTVSIVEFKDLKPMTTEGDYRYELKEGEYIFKLGIDDLKVEHDYPIPKYVRITKRSDKKCSIVITCNSVTNLSISGIVGGNIIECVKITKEMEGAKSKDNANEYIAYGVCKLNVSKNSIDHCICDSLLATIGSKHNRTLAMLVDSKVKNVTITHDEGVCIINSVISNDLKVNEDKLEFIG